MSYTMQSPPGARTLINGRWCDYFSGTGYLGLQGHPGLLAAASDALARYGLTTATSRGGYGEHPLFASVESAAARYWDTDAALYYVTGYLGSAVLLQGLSGDYDRIFVDESSHFSVWDAARAGPACPSTRSAIATPPTWRPFCVVGSAPASARCSSAMVCSRFQARSRPCRTISTCCRTMTARASVSMTPTRPASSAPTVAAHWNTGRPWRKKYPWRTWRSWCLGGKFPHPQQGAGRAWRRHPRRRRADRAAGPHLYPRGQQPAHAARRRSLRLGAEPPA